MKLPLFEKQSFSVIGKLGQGSVDKASEWVARLWQEVNGNFGEISSLVSYHDGKIAGVWGAMSDIDEEFKPWNDQGKYLAGCEIAAEVIPPDGWSIWTIPSFKYVVAECTQAEYGGTFSHIIKEYLPENNYTLVGAVHEFTPSPAIAISCSFIFQLKSSNYPKTNYPNKTKAMIC